MTQKACSQVFSDFSITHVCFQTRLAKAKPRLQVLYSLARLIFHHVFISKGLGYSY